MFKNVSAILVIFFSLNIFSNPCKSKKMLLNSLLRSSSLPSTNKVVCKTVKNDPDLQSDEDIESPPRRPHSLLSNFFCHKASSKALTAALKNKNYPFAQALVSKGATFETNEDAETPLHRAIKEENSEFSSIIKIFSPQVDNITRTHQLTALHMAAAENFSVAINKLVEWNAFIDPEDAYNNTPLMYALLHENYEAFNQLLIKGADFKKVNYFGQTPAHLAALKNDIRFMRELIYKGAKLSNKDVLGYTPLDYAAANNNLAMVILIKNSGGISSNANCNFEDLHKKISNQRSAYKPLRKE